MPIGDELMEAILDFGASSSFPSGHSASTVAIAATYMLAGIHGALVWALGLPIIFSRVTLVHHHLSDVVGGLPFGLCGCENAVCAYRWCEAFLKRGERRENFS